MTGVFLELNELEFINLFKESSRKDHYSEENLKVIYDNLWNFSDDTGETVLFDIPAICEDYTELPLNKFLEYYNLENMSVDEIKELEGILNIDSNNNVLIEESLFDGGC